jgi:hypothetical protein
VSLATNLGRINSLKQFHKNKINTSSRDQLQNPQYLSISNLKDNPKGSNQNHHGFRKKKLGNSTLIHSRSKDEQNFYSNVISPLPDIKDNAELYAYDKFGYQTHRLNRDFKKHQKSTSLAESNLHNLYSISQQSSSILNDFIFNQIEKTERRRKGTYQKSFTLKPDDIEEIREVQHKSKSPRLASQHK